MHIAALATALSAVVASLALADPAAAIKTPTNIAPQELHSALRVLAAERHLQILYTTQTVANWHTSGAVGELTVDEALSRLLGGTGLVFRYIDESTITIIPLGDGPAQKTSFTPAGATEGEDRVQLEEVVITGTHIRGVTQLSAPSITFTRQDIEKTGYSKVEDLFRSLPQNLAEIGTQIAGADGVSELAVQNAERAAGINLRGLGAQSTLVLVNGRRQPGSVSGRVVDISAIPLSLIERVEVATGGRSAIYGSDAVAGVVNLVTRRDFDGAESRAYYGSADSGGASLQLGQIYGDSFERGGFVAAYDYANDGRLDATDAGIVRAPSVDGIVVTPGAHDLQPDSERHAIFLSGKLTLSESVELYADGFYTSNRNRLTHAFSIPGRFDFFNHQVTESDQYNFAPGLRFDVNDEWSVDLAATYGETRMNLAATDTFGSIRSRADSALSSVSVVLDGALFSSARADVKAAIGAEGRWESVENSTSSIVSVEGDRAIHSAFAEAVASFGAETSAGRRPLQLSIAARYSDYSDFGDSFDPQVGIVWNAAAGLTLRTAYSTAFRAPDLFSLSDTSGQQVRLRLLDDTSLPGRLPVFIRSGNNPGLQPEQAETWSVGLEYTLPFAPAVQISMSYFDIRYDDRIEVPAAGADLDLALINADRYPGLIDRSPSADELQAALEQALAQGGFLNATDLPFDPSTQSILEVFPNVVLFDDRFQNISSDTIKGLDLAVQASRQAAFGTLSFDLLATYYLEFERKVTSGSAALVQLNAPGKPVDFRLRASAGWSRGAFGTFVYLNHVDGYSNVLVTPAAEMDSWTTADITLRIDVSQTIRGAWLHGLSATLGVRNVLDEKPPELLGTSLGLAYDAANADALGRFISLEIGRKW